MIVALVRVVVRAAVLTLLVTVAAVRVEAACTWAVLMVTVWAVALSWCYCELACSVTEWWWRGNAATAYRHWCGATRRGGVAM